jgi:hypothetical protein
MLPIEQAIFRRSLQQLLLACAFLCAASADDGGPLRPTLPSRSETRALPYDLHGNQPSRSATGIQSIGQQSGQGLKGSALQGTTRSAALQGLDADSPDLMSTAVSYVVFDQPLDVVVQELGRMSGYAVSTTREVRGKVASGRIKGTLGDVMQKLKTAHGLVTMRDGTRLFVASDSESQVRYIKVGTEAPGRVRDVLQNLKVDDLDRRVTVDEAAGLVQINAPPLISERIETILINASKSASPNSAGVAVIRFGKRGKDE